MEREVGPYIYRVKLYLDYAEDGYEYETKAGVTFASTWSKAMKHIEDYYGTELIAVEGLDELEAYRVLELPYEVAKGIVDNV